MKKLKIIAALLFLGVAAQAQVSTIIYSVHQGDTSLTGGQLPKDSGHCQVGQNMFILFGCGYDQTPTDVAYIYLISPTTKFNPITVFSATERQIDSLPLVYWSHTDSSGHRTNYSGNLLIYKIPLDCPTGWLEMMGSGIYNYTIKDSVYISPIPIDTTKKDTTKKDTNHVHTGIIQYQPKQTLLSIIYYNIQGQQIQEPPFGLYIRKEVYTDGTVRVEKIFKQ